MLVAAKKALAHRFFCASHKIVFFLTVLCPPSGESFTFSRQTVLAVLDFTGILAGDKIQIFVMFYNS